MELIQVNILTNQLLLIPVSQKYKQDIFREFTKEITTYMYPRPPKNMTETEEFIHDSVCEMQTGNHLVMVILKKDSQEFLGCTGIHEIYSKNLVLGIWLKKSAHAQGYGLEAITALKSWADENLDYEYLIYDVDQENIPSRRIAEKLGGQIVREYNKTNLSGRVLHILEYRISRKENLLEIHENIKV
ncbi:GNAT family N-acetyltransferase [Brasilonema sp. UFV-L1]|uniref:GNAT family N-acetyltransferase n=1 Tax=Brasilonema sp. UFV-L1 TaxID=2234130 RepID=UPI00145E954C|nr:GNAT family N-acetyltransferase [Brasilonema sp. UFV-L1]NMG07600.1 N-acetyltransferase [Brasilonema sp. UFV-L1]